MKTLTRRKATRHLIFGLLCLLPILVLLFLFFRTGFTEAGSIDEIVGEFWSTLAACEDVPFVADFTTWLQDTIFEDGISIWARIAISYFSYLVIISALDLMFSFFFCMIDLFKSWMDKLGGVEK